jgi:gliding motility-associated-like protein
MLFKKVWLCAVIFSCFHSAYSQTDTLFWFVAPEVLEGGSRMDEPVVFTFSSLQNPAQVWLDMPANPSFNTIAFSLNANDTRTIQMSSFLNTLENKPPNTILNKGIRIRATAAIAVYYEVVSSFCNCNPEIFTLKGQKALGHRFFVPFQDTFRNGGLYTFTPTPYAAFDIVATEDNTNVAITPSRPIVGRPAGATFTITLQKGQTYSAAAPSVLGSANPSGSKVVSDKPIAITIKDDKIGLGSCADLIGDQLIPIDHLGTDYIVMRGFLQAPDRIHILAVENNTVVRINNVVVATLQEGQTHVLRLTAPTAFISASQNVYVWHVSGFGCEVGAAIIPTIQCTGSQQVGFTRSNNTDFFLMVLVESGGEHQFRVNGNPNIILGSGFADVPFAGNWKYLVLGVNPSQIVSGANTIVSNATHRFHLGIVHGTRDIGCRFGYFSDFGRAITVKASAVKTSLCIGETLELKGNTNLVQGSFWTGPQQFYSQEQNPTIAQINESQQGYYVFHVPGNDCQSGKDSVFINIKPKAPKPILVHNAPLCLFDTLLMTIQHRPTFPFMVQWISEHSPLFAIGDTLIAPSVTADLSKGFAARIVPLVSSFCPSDTTETGPILKPFPPKPSLQAGKSLCSQDTLRMDNMTPHDNDVTYFWRGPQGNIGSSFKTLLIPGIQPAQSGYYSLRLQGQNGCFGETDSILIDIIDYPNQQLFTFNHNSPVCAGESLTLEMRSPEDNLEVRWRGPDGLAVNTPLWMRSPAAESMSGSYWLEVSRQNRCFLKDTPILQLVVFPVTTAQFSFTPNTPYVGESVRFTNLSQHAIRHFWSFSDGFTSDEADPTHAFSMENRFSMTMFAFGREDRCSDSITKSIDVFAREVGVFIPTAFSPNGDGKNDAFYPVATGVSIDISLAIYNRWGEKLFTTHQARNEHWDGTFMGKECPADTYVYVVHYSSRDGKPLMTKGTFTLIR